MGQIHESDTGKLAIYTPKSDRVKWPIPVILREKEREGGGGEGGRERELETLIL